MDKERLKHDLWRIHSALDDACGDTDITHLSDDELRESYPVQWAVEKLAMAIYHHLKD